MIMTMSKHENLVKMKSAGINVPAFHVLTHKFLKDFYDKNESLLIMSKMHHEMLGLNSEKVSVRSSGNYSTPGRMSTKLNVDNLPNALSMSIYEVYQSSKHPSVESYLKSKNIEDFEMNIIIQEMITAGKNDLSGVLTNIHPVTNEKQLYVNCVLGQNGDKLMSGLVKPIPLSDIVNKPEHNDGFLSLIEQTGLVMQLFKCPQEIEFIVKDNIAYILQSRDFNPVKVVQQLQIESILATHDLIGLGESATPFDCIGKVTTDRKNCKGKILLTEYTDFEDTQNLIDCLGIITYSGGTLSHAAIIAREFNKPCIVGVELNVELIEDDLIVMHHKGGIFKKR